MQNRGHEAVRARCELITLPPRDPVDWWSWTPRPVTDLPGGEVSLVRVDDDLVVDLARSRLEALDGTGVRFVAAPPATSTGAPVRVAVDLDGLRDVEGEEHLVELAQVESIERRGPTFRLTVDGVAVASFVADTATLHVEELSPRRPPYLLVSSDDFWADAYAGVWDLATTDEYAPELVDPDGLDVTEALAARIAAWSAQGNRGARGTSWREEQEAIAAALRAAMPGTVVRTRL